MDLMKEIPEKSKQVWERLKEDWTVLSAPEKAGIIALAIVTAPGIAVIAADYLGRRHVKAAEVV